MVTISVLPSWQQPTTKELVLEEKRVWSESSSVFVEEQSDEDFGEDYVFACI